MSNLYRLRSNQSEAVQIFAAEGRVAVEAISVRNNRTTNHAAWQRGIDADRNKSGRR
ncbi:hypothetical protein FHW94_000278 [Novosphingobium sp. SG720]|nr:hypothetical protein [Novosphingobium sp. SG720]